MYESVGHGVISQQHCSCAPCWWHSPSHIWIKVKKLVLMLSKGSQENWVCWFDKKSTQWELRKHKIKSAWSGGNYLSQRQTAKIKVLAIIRTESTFFDNYFYIIGFPLHIKWYPGLLLRSLGLMKSGPCGPVQPSLHPPVRPLLVTAQEHRPTLSAYNSARAGPPQWFQTHGPWAGEGRRENEKKTKERSHSFSLGRLPLILQAWFKCLPPGKAFQLPPSKVELLLPLLSASGPWLFPLVRLSLLTATLAVWWSTYYLLFTICLSLVSPDRI